MNDETTVRDGLTVETVTIPGQRAAGDTSLLVRPARRDDDLDGVNDDNPHWPGSGFLWRWYDAVSPQFPTLLLVAVDGNELVGIGRTAAAPQVAYGYAHASVYVPGRARGRGIGSRLFAVLLDSIRSEGIAGVQVSVDPDDERTVAIVRGHGFVEQGTHYESSLDLGSLDQAAVTAALTRAAAAGYVVETLPPDVGEPVLHEVHEFLDARQAETPDSRGGGTAGFTYPMFLAALDEPWQVAVARRDGTLVAASQMMRRHDGPGRLNTMLTGVHPDARGLGLSTAVKAKLAEEARRRGFTEIVTQNMTTNAPILAANDRLGFRRLSSYVDYGLAL